MAKEKGVKTTGSGVVIKQCSCSHPYQDARYGNKMRVHNCNCKNQAKCTVCSSTK